MFKGKITQIIERRELVWNMVLRNLKIRYKSSVLGFLWTLLNPLFMALIYLIFIGILRFKIDIRVLLTGIIPWQFFVMCLSDSVNSVSGNTNLVKKTYFPRIILPFSMVIANLVFIGDSITAGWETGAGKEIWEKYYSKKKSLNLGFGGDRTEHVIWRLQNGNFDGINPKLVVLMIGTNNTGRRMDNPVMIAEGIKLIIETIHLKSPSTKILLLGIFPREKTKDGPMRKNNDNVNEIIKNYPKNYKFVDYLDISKNFLNEDGTLSREIMYDLLHLTSKGYEIWAEALEEKIKELMEE